jgi:hypothetical protein
VEIPTVGGFIYPDPGFVKFKVFIPPTFSRIIVAAAPTPPPPEKVIIGVSM